MTKTEAKTIRVVVVDDSPTVRQLLVGVLEDTPNLRVVGTGANGQDAVRLTRQLHPDVVTIDVRMPVMDGLQATRQIMHEVPTPIVIVTGDLMHADVDITFEALRAGALTVVRTPGLADREGCRGLVRTVRLMAGVPVVHHWRRAEPLPRPPAAPTPAVTAALARGLPTPVEMVGIAASTGGPGALATILRQLPANFGVPIVVVQHVAAGFAAGLAEWLGGQTVLRVSLAKHGDWPQPGSVLVAPDDYHLQINSRGIVELCREPAYKGLRPSANYLFRSLAEAYGRGAVGVILTGMGDDGAEGLGAMRQAGALTIAQNEASCVVYGMPRQAVLAGVVEQSLPPDEIAHYLVALDESRKPWQPLATAAARARAEECGP